MAGQTIGEALEIKHERIRAENAEAEIAALKRQLAEAEAERDSLRENGAFVMREDAQMIIALRARVETMEKERDEAISDAREIAETNLHAQAYIDGQTLAAQALRARVETLEAALRAIAAYPAERFDVIASDMRHIARAALAGKE